jgi:hypothetical protein
LSRVKHRKCASCGARRPIEELIKHELKYACHPEVSKSCAAKLYLSALDKKEDKKRKEYNKRTKELKKASEWRGDLYGKLGKLVNQYCKHVVYRGEPCYTCGKKQGPNDSPGSFHAGHYKAAKSVDPRRFMHCNIRIQCYSCNFANSGQGAEYRKRLTVEKGLEWVEWLETEANHKPLKQQYPGLDDIRGAIDNYRRMLRDAGIRPNAFNVLVRVSASNLLIIHSPVFDWLSFMT